VTQIGSRLLESLRQAPAAHLLAASVCVGLSLALAVRLAHPGLAAAAAALALSALALDSRRGVALALALAAAGWWWGSERLGELDRSALAAEIDRAALARLEVTGPARRSEFAVRVPVRVLRFGRLDLRERARLDLPPERAPPQGAILDAVVTVTRPREPEKAGGFDEAGYLHRQGIHVVLRAGAFRVVGRRGGVGGLADRLRATVARSLAPGLEGERRAVIAGVVLGEDEGLEEELRDRFRASGLYHLMAVSGQNVAYVVAGMILFAWALGFPPRSRQS
jgi:competence protein ComEC